MTTNFAELARKVANLTIFLLKHFKDLVRQALFSVLGSITFIDYYTQKS